MEAYICNALGFFIQLFPCAVMVFLPFSEEAYRFRRKTIFAGMVIVSAVLALIFPAIPVIFSRYSTFANLYMTAAILLMLAAYGWLVREAVVKKVMVFLCVMFYAASQFFLVNWLDTILDNLLINTPLYQPYTPVYNIQSMLLYLITAAVLLPIMLAVVIRPLREFNREIRPENMKREFLVAIFSTVAFFVMIGYVSSVTTVMALTWVLIFPFLIIEQIIIYWLVFRETVRRQRDDDKRRSMEIQQLQYEKIAGEIENTRRMRHDLRHHYSSLNDMLEKGQLKGMKEYLSQVIDTAIKRDNEVYCQNMTVNGLLQYYVGLARDEGIACKIHAECGELAIESTDLTVLFGNAMENAINACRKCSKDRWICVQLGTVQGVLAIEISNSCKGAHIDRRYQTEDGFSPAEAFPSSRDGGGYGLRSLTHTAQKYGGDAQFRFNAETEVFTTRILLNQNMKTL